MYLNFEDLHKAYGFDNSEQTRGDLTEDRERAFVNDCFDTYEHIGFAKTFESPYDEYEEYKGKPFVVLGRAPETRVDLECLPMWDIKFEDGKEICAHPEEICLAE